MGRSTAEKSLCDLAPGFRDARFCASWFTGDWWGGRPEELQLYVASHNRIPLLAFSKGNRTAGGYSLNGPKPQTLRQSTKPFFYDLSNPSHIEAFLGTIRHMAAFSAGLDTDSHRYPYKLDLGDVVELCRTPLSSSGFFDPKQPDKEIVEAYEVLQVYCGCTYDTDANDDDYCRYRGGEKVSNRKVMAPPKKVYHFKIKRVGVDDIGVSRLVATINNSTHLSIPQAAVPRLSVLGERLLRQVYAYMLRHPEQRKRRWELLFPQHNWSRQLVPRLRHAFKYVAEDVLFTHPSALKRKVIRRLKKGHRELSLESVTNTYYRRLRWLEAGVLQWPPTWNVAAYEAAEDLTWLRAKIIQIRLTLLLAVSLIVALLKKYRRRDIILRRTVSMYWSFTSQTVLHKPRLVCASPRGPPK